MGVKCPGSASTLQSQPSEWGEHATVTTQASCPHPGAALYPPGDKDHTQEKFLRTLHLDEVVPEPAKAAVETGMTVGFSSNRHPFTGSLRKGKGQIV